MKKKQNQPLLTRIHQINSKTHNKQHQTSPPKKHTRNHQTSPKSNIKITIIKAGPFTPSHNLNNLQKPPFQKPKHHSIEIQNRPLDS